MFVWFIVVDYSADKIISAINNGREPNKINMPESFSPNVKKVCRYCNATQEDICAHFHNSHFDSRTFDTYNEQASIVEEFPSYSSVYGIISRSEFNWLQYFHVIGRQPFDIYHDVFEGFAADVPSTLISFFAQSGYFTLE